MDLSAAMAAQAALERFLGDPREATSRITFADALFRDEREDFPEPAVLALDAWGLPRYYVPSSCGGALRSFEVLAALVRSVARRDLTVAIAHAKTFLGAGPVWIAGTAAQKEQLGAAVAAGDKVALGLTEEAHGGDLFATETAAVETPAGYLLSGEKWLINNATRGDVITVLARTDARGGPRGFSLFLIVKREISGFTHLPKIATHGIRGADISGIRFAHSLVPASARIGGAGQGLSIIMKSLQITRTLVPALSLGALDTALREVLAFARGRRIGQGPVVELPHARRILSAAFVELLAAEAVVRAGARSIHVVPERLALVSAVVKLLVPERVDAALRRLAVVLGARHYLRGAPFEKLLRDHALVALFDGSTVVNLSALAQELSRLDKARSHPLPATDAQRACWAALFDLRQEPPTFQPERLELMSRGSDEVPQWLALAQAEIEQLAEGELAEDLRGYLLALMVQMGERARQSVAEKPARSHSLAQTPESFAAAASYARVHAAALCTLVWLRNRCTLDAFFARGEWLALALFQLLSPDGAEPPAVWYERVFLQLCALDAAQQSFALEPIPISIPVEQPGC